VDQVVVIPGGLGSGQQEVVLGQQPPTPSQGPSGKQCAHAHTGYTGTHVHTQDRFGNTHAHLYTHRHVGACVITAHSQTHTHESIDTQTHALMAKFRPPCHTLSTLEHAQVKQEVQGHPLLLTRCRVLVLLRQHPPKEGAQKELQLGVMEGWMWVRVKLQEQGSKQERKLVEGVSAKRWRGGRR